MKVLSKMLQGECKDLKTVCNGLQAVEEFRDSGPYDLAILDVHMPVMGGEEAAAWIRELNPTVPILFLSEEFASEMHDYNELFSPCEVLIKPFSKPELLEVSMMSQVVMQFSESMCRLPCTV